MVLFLDYDATFIFVLETPENIILDLEHYTLCSVYPTRIVYDWDPDNLGLDETAAGEMEKQLIFGSEYKHTP